jgi:8-oxo-dGTP diphosphatase
MKHRIGAGVIVEEEGRILLVRHVKPGIYDFWVAPGGGAEGTEDLVVTAKREVLEESGILVEPTRLAYIEEIFNSDLRECKVWFVGHVIGGSINDSEVMDNQEHIVEAAWLSRSEFEGKTVFPPMLQSEYWIDKENGFIFPRYVGLREMKFY